MRSRIKALTKSFNKFKKQKGVWWQVAVLACFLVIASLFLYSPGVVPVPPADAQNNVPNMVGWAWSSNVGWISVNCANPPNNCDDHSWGLTLMPTANNKREIVGYAWNEKIGWIKFNPPGPYPTTPNNVAAPTYMENPANVDLANKRVLGWARACNVFVDGQCGTTANKNLKPDIERGGWDGWISMGQSTSVPPQTGGQPYGVIAVEDVVNSTTILRFNHFAWGQTVLGWVNFNPRNSDDGVICCTGNTLTIEMKGGGKGQVAKADGTVLCNKTGAPEVTCVLDVSSVGSSVSLRSSANAGSKFDSWGNACSGILPNCDPDPLDLSAESKIVTATFSPDGGTQKYSLSVTKSGDGSGTVSSNPSGVNCGNDCSENYDEGDVVVLSYTLGERSEFVGWSGACTGSAATCSVTMSQARTVNAEFKCTSNCGGDPTDGGPSVNFTAPTGQGLIVPEGGATRLVWESSGEDPYTCEIDGTTVADDGTLDVGPMSYGSSDSIIYTIRCTEDDDPADSATDTITISRGGIDECLADSDVTLFKPAGVASTNDNIDVSLTSSGGDRAYNQFTVENKNAFPINIKVTVDPRLSSILAAFSGGTHSNPEHTACLKGYNGTSPILPTSASDCSESASYEVTIPAGAKRHRVMAVFATQPGSLAGKEGSPYKDWCADGACKFGIKVEASAGGSCLANTVDAPGLFDLDYSDSDIGGQKFR